MQSITHVSTAVTVKLCHSTVNNRSNRQTLCALNGQQHARCKRSHREVESKGEREKEKEVLVASLFASLLAGPCEDSREGFTEDQDVKTVDVVKPL